MVTLDNVVAFVNKTLLNPVFAILLPIGLQLATNHKIELTFPSSVDNHVPHVTVARGMKSALYYLLACLVLRGSSFLSRKALNNGVRDTYDWEKEVVVVTGGAGGIGGEVVRQLASKGTKIAVLDILPLSYPKPANVDYYKCDLTNVESLRETAEKIRARWGNPTVLCAIAGIVRAKPLFDLTKRDLDLTFGVNVIGLALCYKEFVPAMSKANHGHVVTMASQTAYMAVGSMVDYAASKSAALTLHEGLQTELKHICDAPRVRCTVVLPATVSTKMFTGLQTPSQFVIPILRPEEVANEISQAIWVGEARHIEMPWMGKMLTPLARVMPTWWRIGMQDRAKDSMKTFKGHKVID